MRFYGDVIARRGKRYWRGRIKRGEFYPDEELKQDEVDLAGCVTLKEYSVILGFSMTNAELKDIRRKTRYTEIWVMDQPPPKITKSGDVSDTKWERWYFRFLHPMCRDCERDCKQSSRVSLICPSFKKKDK